MRKLWKALALVLALAMLFAAVSGCAAKTDAETESQQTETAAPAAQEETDASGVPGVEDEALAAKLIEQAKHPLYQLCDSDPTCTNGIVAPYQKSRAAIDKAIPTDAGTYTKDKIKLGFQVYMMENDWFVEIVEGAKAAAADYGVELVVVSANATDEGCLSAVENLITQGCQGIMLNAVSLDVNNKLANMCTEAGVMCVGAGIAVGADTGVLTSYTTNNFWSGFAVGEEAAKKLSGEHIVAACSLSYWGETNAESRMAGMTAGVFWVRTQEMGLSYSQLDCAELAVKFWEDVRKNGSARSDEFDFEIVSGGESNNTEEGGQTTAENAFTAHPDINLFIANNDFEGMGVAYGAEAMGIKLGEGGCWIISANDGYIKALDKIRVGEYLATCDGGSYANGYACVALMCEILLNGYDANDLPPLTCSSYEPITVEAGNIDKYYIEGAVLSRGEPPATITIPEYNAMQAAALANE